MSIESSFIYSVEITDCGRCKSIQFGGGWHGWDEVPPDTPTKTVWPMRQTVLLRSDGHQKWIADTVRNNRIVSRFIRDAVAIRARTIAAQLPDDMQGYLVSRWQLLQDGKISEAYAK